MADSEFPKGGPLTKKRGQEHIILANFPKKLHENEKKNRTETVLGMHALLDTKPSAVSP